MKVHLLAAALVGAASTHVLAADVPLKNAGFDPATLTRENFYEVLVPLAKAAGPVVMYNFAGSFADTWTEGLIKPFEAKYGIKVEYSDVKGAQANQQLIAVHEAGQDAPVDAYFVGGGDYPLLVAAKVIPSLNLAAILPSMDGYDPARAQVVFGKEHGGTFNLVHLNQTAIGYDSAFVKPEEAPRTFDDLLAWAEKNPKKLAVTLPSKGGSGGGFIYSVAANYLEGDCKAALTNYDQTADEMLDWVLTSDCLTPVWDYYTKLLAVAELTNGNADTLNLINNQSAHVGTVWEDQVMTFIRNKQLPESFRLTLLEKGQIGGGDAFIIPANAKNVAGALLLLDMAYGKEFQAWKLENKASRSPRLDLSDDLITPQTRTYLVPGDKFPALSIPAFWGMSTALATGLDEKVLNR